MVHRYLEAFSRLFKRIMSPRTILFVRLAGGFYFRLSSNRIITIFTRLYCILCCVGVPVFLICYAESLSSPAKTHFVCVAIMYIIYCVIALLTESENIGGFLENLEELDIANAIHLGTKVPISGFLLLFTLLFEFLAYLWLSKVYFLKLYTVKPISFWILAYYFTETLLGNFIRIMMFELLWYRVRALKKDFKMALSQLHQPGEFLNVRTKLRKCLNKYKNILDTVEKIHVSVKIMTLVTAVLGPLKIILWLYYFIGKAYLSNLPIPKLLETFLDLTIFCSPAFLVELSIREVNDIKMYIKRQLLNCKDYNMCTVIEDCLIYLKYNPYKYSVWRLFSMDRNMAISMINICITYTIAMIQFTHLSE